MRTQCLTRTIDLPPATNLSPSQFDAILLVVDTADLSLSNSSHSPATFLDLVLPSLKPLGNLTWATPSDISEIESALKQSSAMTDVRIVSGADGAKVGLSSLDVCVVAKSRILTS